MFPAWARGSHHVTSSEPLESSLGKDLASGWSLINICQINGAGHSKHHEQPNAATFPRRAPLCFWPLFQLETAQAPSRDSPHIYQKSWGPPSALRLPSTTACCPLVLEAGVDPTNHKASPMEATAPTSSCSWDLGPLLLTVTGECHTSLTTSVLWRR
jgi:hypothetical protein